MRPYAAMGAKMGEVTDTNAGDTDITYDPSRGSVMRYKISSIGHGSAYVAQFHHITLQVMFSLEHRRFTAAG